METSRIAVLGAGLIGRKHIDLVREHAHLLAVVDPTDVGREVAEEFGAPWFASLAELLAVDRPDGVIIATPNQVHVENGLECVAAGIPILVEKPIADDSGEAERLVQAAADAGVPILVGHHRRHNPIIQAARGQIESGTLGDIISVNAQCWFYKPDDYFNVEWRRKKGAGPVFINLIHDVDNLRYLCGEIVAVQAMESSVARGNEVEDTAVVLLEFVCGALGTVTVSDAITAPFSWELTAGENPAYPKTDAFCYTIGGRLGTLSVPDLGLWFSPGEPGWWEPIEKRDVPVAANDPFVTQLSHFYDVIRGEAAPVVSGAEGVATLKVIEAIKAAAANGGRVTV